MLITDNSPREEALEFEPRVRKMDDGDVKINRASHSVVLVFSLNTLTLQDKSVLQRTFFFIILTRKIKDRNGKRNVDI